MARLDEISSTEKLLNVIRSDGPTGAPGADISPASSPRPVQHKEVRLPFFSGVVRGGEVVTVGIDIGAEDVRLVKIAQTSDRKWRFLDLQIIPFDPEIPRDSPNFFKFLKSVLTRFSGSIKKSEIWCSIPSANVEVRQVRIPKVAKKQVANSVYWTFKKEVPFDDKRNMFDYMLQGEITESGIKKIVALAYAAPRDEVKQLQDLFIKAGFPLTGISITPFSVQNLIKAHAIDDGGIKTVCNLYIGREWSRIDIFSEGNLVLVRGIKTGINSMVEEIVENFSGMPTREEEPAAPVPEAREETDDRIPFEIVEAENSLDDSDTDFSFVDDAPPQTTTDPINEPPTFSPADATTVTPEQAWKILFSICPDAEGLTADSPGYGLSEDDIFNWIEPAVERLIRQVERTFQFYNSTYGGEPVGRILTASRLDTSKRLIAYLGDQLGIASTIIDPLSFNKVKLGTIQVPAQTGKRLSFTPAMGLALSNNSRTPNFLFTQKDKDQLAKAARLDRVVFGIFLLLVAGCLGVYKVQSNQLHQKEDQRAYYQAELARYVPEPDRNLILQAATKVAGKKQQLRAYQEKYQHLAAISELVALTPANVTLRNCDLVLGSPNGTKGKEGIKALVLEGKLTGERSLLESAFAGYVIRLANSPLFKNPKVVKSTIESDAQTDLLTFILNVEVL